MNKKGDENRSVRNTKKKLRAVFLELLHEKPLNEITVRELTELADVNRGTFYFHYSDIYDMLAKLENEFFAEFDEIVKSMVYGKENSAVSFINETFSCLSRNADLAGVLLGPHGDMDFVNRLKSLVFKKCSNIWQSINPHADAERFDLFNGFIINGFIGLFETWFSSGQKQTPEEITAFAFTIIKGGLKESLAEEASSPKTGGK